MHLPWFQPRPLFYNTHTHTHTYAQMSKFGTLDVELSAYDMKFYHISFQVFVTGVMPFPRMTNKLPWWWCFVCVSTLLKILTLHVTENYVFIKQPSVLELLDPADGGTMLLWNVRTMYHLTKKKKHTRRLNFATYELCIIPCIKTASIHLFHKPQGFTHQSNVVIF